MLRLVIPIALASVVACAAASEPAPAAPVSAEVAAAAVVSTSDTLAAPPAASAFALDASYAPTSDVGCDIYRARTLHGLRLEAVVDGFEASPETLEYAFVVTKSGPSGAADIVQAGEVSETALGAVDLSLAGGDRFHATLTLSDSQGEVCTAELGS